MKPIRDPAYLAWIRTLPCIISGRRPVEAHHALPGAMAQKASDLTAIPLSIWLHRLGPEAVHNLGRREFSKRFNLDIPAIIRQLNRRYWELQIEQGAARPSPGLSALEASA